MNWNTGTCCSGEEYILAEGGQPIILHVVG